MQSNTNPTRQNDIHKSHPKYQMLINESPELSLQSITSHLPADGKRTGDVKLEEKKQQKNRMIIYMASIAAINGSLYFFVSAAGGQNLKNFLNLNGPNANQTIYGLSAGSSICYTMFMYKTFENLTLKPNHPLAWVLAILSPFAASSFFTAGTQGAQMLSVAPVAIPIGLALFLLRTVSMLDGSVKFPARLKDVATDLVSAIQNRKGCEIFRLLTTIYTSVGFSVSTSDAIYSASSKFIQLLGASQTSSTATIFPAISSTLGVFGTLPLAFYWTHRGVKQLTFGGKPDDSGVNKDPSDVFTALAAVGTIPVTLGILGNATAASGQAFAKAGAFASFVRISSSLCYSVAGGVPGLSTLFRSGYSSCKSVLFHAFSSCRTKTREERALLPEKTFYLRKP